jgi:metal-sulfur cluster biosynthetic enzyme
MTENNKIISNWDAETTHPETSVIIKQALRDVRDPELGMDIIQLGLVRNVTIESDKVKMVMILTTPYCPYAPMMMESARKKTEEVSGKPTEIEYGSEVWNQSMMEEGSGFDWGIF